MNNKIFKIFVINYYGNLPKILDQLDVHVQHNGLFLCPMHDNYNTPAAKIFKDSTGWHFYCFNEQKQFGTYDVYKEVCGLNMDLVFDNLWKQLSEEEKKKVINTFGEYDDNAPLENIGIYQAFKNGQLTYKQLIQELCKDLVK